jgi:hypothetical protein
MTTRYIAFRCLGTQAGAKLRQKLPNPFGVRGEPMFWIFPLEHEQSIAAALECFAETKEASFVII